MVTSHIQRVGIFILLVLLTTYLTLNDYMPFTIGSYSGTMSYPSTIFFTAAHENTTDDTTSLLSIGILNRTKIVLDWTKFFGSDYLSATWNVRLHNSLLQIFYSRLIARCQITVHAHTPVVWYTFWATFRNVQKISAFYRWSVRLYVHVKSVAACKRGRRNMQ
jgi:hypothetical protein